MNNLVEQSPPSKPVHDATTRILQWLEALGLALDYGRLRRAHPEDSWWVTDKQGEVTGPHRLREVLTMLVDGMGPIQIVNTASAGEEPPPWKTLDYQPLWLNRKIAMLWNIGLCIAGIAVLYAIIWGATPMRFRVIVDAAFLLGLALFGVRKASGRLRPSPLRGRVDDRKIENAKGRAIAETAEK
jgi:hypothetical protein